jgi:signal transduction histidine kinase
MQLKTSTKISLKFTFFTTILLLIFSILIIALFFRTWYSKQQESLHINTEYESPILLNIIHDSSIEEMRKIFGKYGFRDGTQRGKRRQKQIIVPSLRPSLDKKALDMFPVYFQEESLDVFTEDNGYYKTDFLFSLSKGYIKIFYKDGNYFVYTKKGDVVKFLNVTGFIYAQAELIQLLFLWDIGFIAVVYLVSLYFVKSSLKNLKKLTIYAKNLDFDHLATPLKFKGHPNDEIKVIADAFDASLQRISIQILSLKDFIANASHELKTPLMMINTEIDIALKKKDYEERFLNIKQNVKRLSDLLDNLSLITRLESLSQLDTKQVNMFELVQSVLGDLEKKYPEKRIQVFVHPDLIISAQPVLLGIVIKNLLDNACKYA